MQTFPSGRDASTDSPAIAQAIATRMISTLEEGKVLNEEQLSVNGMKAYRFEVTGKSKALFHPEFTYVVTLLEGNRELVVVNAWTPSYTYMDHKDDLRKLAFRISGVSPSDTENIAPSPTTVSVPASGNPARVALPSAPPSVPATSAVISGTSGSAAIQPLSSTVADKLRELNKLFKDGIITQSEYEAKKIELLKAL